MILEASPYHGTLADRDGTRILPQPRDAEGKPHRAHGLLRPARLRGRDGGPARHRPLGGLPRPPRPDATPHDIKRIVEWAATEWSNGRVGMSGHSYVGSTPVGGRRAAAPGASSRSCRAPASPRCTTTSSRPACRSRCSTPGPIEATSSSRSSASCPAATTRATTSEETRLGLPQLRRRRPASRAARSGAVRAPGSPQRDHGGGRAPRRTDLPGARRERQRRAHHRRRTGSTTRTARQARTTRSGSASGTTARLLPDPARDPVDLRAARLVRQVAAGRASTPARRSRSSCRTAASRRRRAGRPRRGVWPPIAGAARPAPRFSPAGGGRLADESSERRQQPRRSRAIRAGSTDPQGTGGVEFATAGDVRGPRARRRAAHAARVLDHLTARAPDRQPLRPERRGRAPAHHAVRDQPGARDGIATPLPATPGERYELDPPGFTMGHHLRAGHKLVLRVTTSDPDKVPTFAIDPNVTTSSPDREGTSVELAGDPGRAALPRHRAAQPRRACGGGRGAGRDRGIDHHGGARAPASARRG